MCVCCQCSGVHLLTIKQYTQKEIVKQGWITALATLRREIQYRDVADRTDAAAVNSKRLRDYNAIAKNIAQKQVIVLYL